MKESIRETVLALGADVCGFAAAEQFAAAPEGFRPGDIYAPCRSIVVFGIALPKGLMQVEPRLVYGHFNREVTHSVDAIAFRAANTIERQMNCSAVPIPCDNPYEFWDTAKMEGRGLISVKHAAVAAGLGSIGKNTMFLNREYGNRLCLGAILTDLELPPDPPSPDLCLANCRRCIDSCPASAIRDGQVDQLRCRKQTYGKTERGFDTVDCNRCRTACPLRYGK